MKYTITIDIPDEDLEMTIAHLTKKYNYSDTIIKDVEVEGEIEGEVEITEVSIPNPLTLLETISEKVSTDLYNQILNCKKEKAIEELSKNLNTTVGEFNINIT